MTPRYICVLLLANLQNRTPAEQSALERLSNGDTLNNLTVEERAAVTAMLDQVTFSINLARGLCNLEE
jgi:hypothetical protein